MDANAQLEDFKKKIKDEIKSLINKNDITQAASLIREYEMIIKDDIEIANMKAILHMMEGDSHGAKNLLWRAVENNMANADTFYNLAYANESETEYSTAYRFYQKSMRLAENAQLVDDAHVAIQQLEPQMKSSINNEAKRFVILSSCNWGIMLQRPHHIAKALAKFGHIVDYVEPGRQKATANKAGVSVEEAVQFSKDQPKQRGLIQIYTPISLSYENNVIVDNYKSLVHDLVISSTEEVVVICYMPDAVEILDGLDAEYRLIYECVDDHTDLEYSFWNSKRDRESEMKLMERADYITTTSSALYFAKSMKRKNVYLSKNAVNRDDFVAEAEIDIPEDLASIPGPRVCYMGAVYKWFNEELFYETVRANRDLSFVVIGPVMNGLLTAKEENLYVLGPKKHSELKRYLLNMNVGIIPFRDDADIIVNCDPIKLYEYVSCGLSVVATNMPELAVGKDFIKITDGFDSFNTSLRDCLERKPSGEEIEGYLTENDWQTRGRLLLDVLDGNDEEYRKDRIIAKMRELWGELAVNGQNALLQAIYSLTFAETDPTLCMEHARSAYGKLKTSFTLQCYAYAALLNNQSEDIITDVLENPDVSDVFKAELLYLQGNHRSEALRVRTIYLTKQYQLIHDEIKNLPEDEQTIEWAHFYYEMADNDKAKTLYSELLNGRSEYLGSPMLNGNLADLLMEMGELHESQSFRKLVKASVERYIGQDRIENGTVRTHSKKTRFSIVVPTRNSHGTLEYTLRTCLNQSFDDYEIVVSDNSSNLFTKQLIDRLGDPKIKYIKPDQELAMTENFNFAVSQASGEYIIVIGSDDGLLFHALKTLDTLLDSYQVKLIRWNLMAYGWPDVNLEGFENFLGIPSITSGNIGHRYVEGKEVIRAVSQFEVNYDVLPMLYCNSVVHADLIAELISRTGSVFKSLSPDIYSGFALAYLQKTFLCIDTPISIGGSSGNSNGVAHLHGKNKKSEQISNDYLKLNNGTGLMLHSHIPNVKTLEGAIGDSFMRAKESLFPFDHELKLNRKKLMEKCVEVMVNSETTNDALYRMYHTLEDESELQRWFYETYMQNPEIPVTKREPGKFVYKKGFNKENSVLIVNAMEFGVKDVYGAAELFRKLTGW